MYHLAIDIGASSGRHILGWLEDGKMKTQEVYRFTNGMQKQGDNLCWDVFQLFVEILKGMKQCKKLGMVPTTVGIDTWAVDYVLLDQDGHCLGKTYAYRDHRTKNMDQKLHAILNEEKLYKRTGIQKQIFNTIYQLMAVKEQEPELIEKADTFLMIPDYLHFLLTGVKTCEYTNATTTQLVNPETKDWDYELIRMLQLPEHIFPKISLPASNLGALTKEVELLIGYNCRVVLPPTHDTASAVAAVTSSGNQDIYISSGTWSLMGVQLNKANLSSKSRKYNFTNEGGYQYKFRFLKNIMGLWMIQCVKKEIGESYSYDEIAKMARCENIKSVVNCNDNIFLAPKSMVKAIQSYCLKTNQEVPHSLSEMACVIYHSLAKCYAATVKELSEITLEKYHTIHVIGGGSSNTFLNQLIADYCKCEVKAGPAEATAIGNLSVQMISEGKVKDLHEAHEIIQRTFGIKTYHKGGVQ